MSERSSDDTRSRDDQEEALFFEIEHWLKNHKQSLTKKRLIATGAQSIADTAEALFVTVEAAWNAYMSWDIDVMMQRSAERSRTREHNRRIRTQHLRDYDVFLDALETWKATHGLPIERKHLIATGDRILVDAADAHHNGLATAATALEHRVRESWKRWDGAEPALLQWIAQRGHFPTREELDATGFGALRIAIERYLGGWPTVRALLGYTTITEDALEHYMPQIVPRYLAMVPRVTFAAYLEALLRDFPTDAELQAFLATAIVAIPRK